MNKVLRIGTRESQLAVWQATLVKDMLAANGVESELIYIKSEGDIDLVTPLYEIGVTGIFTKTLDAALLSNRIDIAVHSMKDVPVQLAKGITQAAVLKRANWKDIFVPHPQLVSRETRLSITRVSISETYSDEGEKLSEEKSLIQFPVNSREKSGQFGNAIIATSSVRRIAQWLNKYPNDKIENLRGNVNTRLRKLSESNWNGAIFAAAGLERINLRPENAVELDWMLPAPAQGAIMVACRQSDDYSLECCAPLHDEATALCTKVERQFLRLLMGGCSTPIGAIAEIQNGNILFKANVLSTDGKEKAEASISVPKTSAGQLAEIAMEQILHEGGQAIIQTIRNGGK